ncbi:LON peptidase N-terminal domain and RING finger protein 3-like [Trifolium pratense]|uniref:LON peptidase N-terminal domain and RING finger protein 3-like n=1 Tax=Trifolium pratense TaxID=57577 RepID=UPI001E690D82|nr:LON peptidase N-terminal domain and RING finger protein 3-like [Trifolium pratense]
MNFRNLRSNIRRNETLSAWDSSHGERPSERQPTWVSSQGVGPSEQLLAVSGLPAMVSSQGEGPSERIQVPVVDYAENDDDVIETSSRDFAEAVANSRRTRRRIGHASNMENQTMPTYFMHEREEGDSSFIPIDAIYISLEGGTSEVTENATKSLDTNKETLEPENQTPEPPKEPSITCPICMQPTVEEMTTKCGHIFCRKCITPALLSRRKCPTCGKNATMRGLVRVFLPSSRIIDELRIWVQCSQQFSDRSAVGY